MPKFLNDIYLEGSQLKNVVLDKLSADPTEYESGHFYYNTVFNKIRYYNGTVWGDVDSNLSNHSELNLDDGTNPHGTTKSDVGLGSVDNTSDADKPISTLQQTALDAKVDDAQVLTDVPAAALFTDTIYDDAIIQTEVDLNTAKVGVNLPTKTKFSGTQTFGASYATLTNMTQTITEDGVYKVEFTGYGSTESDDIGAVSLFYDGVEVDGVNGSAYREFGADFSQVGQSISGHIPFSIIDVVTVTSQPKVIDIKGKEVLGTDVDFHGGILLITKL